MIDEASKAPQLRAAQIGSSEPSNLGEPMRISKSGITMLCGLRAHSCLSEGWPSVTYRIPLNLIWHAQEGRCFAAWFDLCSSVVAAGSAQGSPNHLSWPESATR